MVQPVAEAASLAIQKHEEDTTNARKLLDELHRRLEHLENAYRTRYTARTEQLDRQIAEAEETVHLAESRPALQRARVQDLNTMTQLQDIPRCFDRTNPVEINKILHIVLKSIVVG